MGMIWLLKALADISVYYIFAAPVAAYFGSTGLVWCGLLQAFAYAIARSAKQKRLLSLSLGAIALSYGLCWQTPAGLVAQTPALAYLIWQYAVRTQIPNLERQRTDFTRLWKLLAPAALLGLILGTFAAFPAPALMAFAAGAALLRTLRHNPETYLRLRFQLVNLGTLACVSVTALVLGSGPVVHTLGAGLRWAYQKALIPFVLWILYLPGKLMQWLIDVLRPLLSIEPDMLENTLPVESGDSPTESVLQGNYQTPPGWDVLKIILLVLLGIAAVIAMFLLFRKLGKGTSNTTPKDELSEIRTTVESVKPRTVSTDTPAVQSVRKHYRRYLKLCVKSGIPVTPGSTSGDVRDSAQKRKALQPHAGRIRQIYIRARYAGLATREDAKEMSKLCAVSKTEKNK